MKRKAEPVSAAGFRPAIVARWGLMGAGLAALWFAFNHETLQQYFEARVQRNENRREVGRLERQIADLEEEKRQLETFGFPAEKTIRERFKMARPGERIIILEEPTRASRDEAGEGEAQ